MKVALIGLGMMGKNHARVLTELTSTELIAIVDPLNAESGLPYTKNSFTDLKSLESIDLDYCVITAPTKFHFEIAEWAINRKLPFLIEKPLTASGDSAVKLAEKVELLNLPAGVGHIERYNAAIREAKFRIKNGELGKILQVRTVRQGPFPGRISDVGVIFDLATHDLDLTAWILEEPCKKVFAQSAAKSEREFEDLVLINSRYESGVIASHSVNWLSPLKERSIQILGERGTFMIDTLNSSLTFYSNGSHAVTQDKLSHFTGVSQGEILTYAFDKPEPLRIEHEKFIEYLQGKSNEIITIAEGAKVVMVAEGVLKSARNGHAIDF
jgi:UDP-N-acetylglucosamine 3-dehydrogenase